MDETKNTRAIFAFRFAELRNDLGMNQSTYAEYLGLSRAHVSFYEKADKEGGRLPDLVNFRRICSKLHVTADYLLGLSSEKTIGKYMSNEIVLDALQHLGFSQDEAALLVTHSLEKPYDQTISAIGSIVNTHSSHDFFAAWNRFLCQFDEDLLYGQPGPGSAITEDDLEFFKKKLGAGGYYVVDKKEYCEAFIDFFFGKQIIPALKSVVEEILLQAQNNDRLMRESIRSTMGIKADN